jgi:hypothetical protein
MPFLYAVSFTAVVVTNTKVARHWFVFTGYSRGILLLVSAYFLGDSIRRIKIAILKVDTTKQMN